MQKEGYWVIRTYQAGQVGEKIKYWVPGKKPSRSQRRIKSDIKKQQQNENDATRRVARIINENFSGGDVFDALTYSDENFIRLTEKMPVLPDEDSRRDYIYQQAEHELDLFLRRCRYACKKAGIEFKYLAITSDMDGETGEPARIHHHIITSKAARKSVRELWKNGAIEKNTVWDEEDHFGLAKYLMDQVRRIPDGHNHSDGHEYIGELLDVWLDGVVSDNDPIHFVIVDRVNQQLNVWKVDKTPQYSNYQIPFVQPETTE